MNSTATQTKNPNSATANIRDLNAAFNQQMFFWGMDAAISSGNLFQKSGFTKTPSPGLKGTSCYSYPWQNGEIFLHGACVGYIPKNGDPGFIYIRPANKCFLWHDTQPPIPGEWDKEKLSNAKLVEDFSFMSPFLDWWLHHEACVAAEMGSAYRANCYRNYKSLSKSKPWLPPTDAIAWLSMLIENSCNTPRPKHFLRPPSR